MLAPLPGPLGVAGFNRAFFSAGNCLVKIWVKFLVKIWVKQNNRNNSIHCNSNGARARSARAPLLFPSPLLFLLSCLIKILTQNLTQIFTKHLAKILTKPWAKSDEKLDHFFGIFLGCFLASFLANVRGGRRPTYRGVWGRSPPAKDKIKLFNREGCNS